MQNEKFFLKIQYPYVGHVGHFVGAIILLCLCWLLVIANAALAAARTAAREKRRCLNISKLAKYFEIIEDSFVSKIRKQQLYCVIS